MPVRDWWHRFRVKAGPFVLAGLRALLGLLPKGANIVILHALTSVLGISGVRFRGEEGEFLGSPQDLHAMGLYVRTGRYSPELVSFVAAQLNGRGTFVDIGANIGLTTVPVARRGSRCISFEPDPENFRFLSENSRSVADRVTLHNLALYDRKGELSFSLSPYNSGDHRVAGKGEGIYGESRRTIIKVPAARLDDVLDIATLSRPVVVKIDTQGAEPGIFRGGERFLSQADVIIFEFSVYLMRQQGGDETYLIDFVRRHFGRGRAVAPGGELGLGDIGGALAEMRDLSMTYPHLRFVDVVVGARLPT